MDPTSIRRLHALAATQHNLFTLGQAGGTGAHTKRSDFDRERLRGNLGDRHGWHVVRWTSTMDDAVILAQVLPYFESRRP